MNELLRRILFLPVQASTVAEDIDSLHYFVILMTMAGATLVTVVGGVFLIIYRRRDFSPGMSIAGPAVIDEKTSTIVLHPGQSAFVDEYLNLEITLQGDD